MDEFAYDANGNMTQRVESGVTWAQTFNAENRLASISNGTETWSFVYDGGGNRVKQINPDGTITVFLGGGLYTIEDAASAAEATKYYSVAGQRIAMQNAGGLQYLLNDHMGSVSAVLDGSGALLSEQRYLPFGGERLTPDIGETDFGFTGQRDLAVVGLMDYSARWYEGRVGRFIQPDIVLPNFTNSQSLNRYAYVVNNPINYTDPTGQRYLDFPDYADCPGGGWWTRGWQLCRWVESK